jgi:hypothetical protein
MTFKDLTDMLDASGVLYEIEKIPDGAVAVFSVPPMSNFIGVNCGLVAKVLSPDKGRVYLYSEHKTMHYTVVNEFLDRVRGFHAEVVLPFRTRSGQTSEYVYGFGLGARIFAPEGCLAVDDGEILSRNTMSIESFS